ERTMVFVHGTSRDDKLWPEAHWAEIGRRVMLEGWRIALPHAGAVERERAERIAAAIGPACEVWPQMDLDALTDRMGAAHGVIGERLGSYGTQPSEGWVWVHAVSLGETRAASALIDALRARRPGMRLLLTHGTATGREAGQALLREGDRQAWLPYDTPGVVNRFFRQFKPQVGVLMETEVWPNLLHAAARHGVRMVLANARLSEKSQRQGKRLAAVIRPAVERISLVLAQTEDDARRLRDAGARQVVVSGNLKFDMTPDAALLARGRAWREALGRPVLMAAATREGE